MFKARLVGFCALLFIAIATSVTLAQHGQTATADDSRRRIAPVADHHQHLFSPAMAKVEGINPVTAQDVVRLLDRAGIKRAVLLSTAFAYGQTGDEPPNEYEKVKEENDWVGAQAALFPKRFRAFCSFNPLKEYALGELARCASDPNLRRGIKLHFGNSDVLLNNPEHLTKLKNVFQAANKHRMAIVVHTRGSISRKHPYGPEQALLFLELLASAPDIPVQVAHLAGTGPGFDDPAAHSVLEVLADAVAKKRPADSQSLVRRNHHCSSRQFC